MVTLTIDGQSVSVPEGTSIMRAAMEAGTQIPKLCATDMVDAFGSCRLCLVEIEGRAGTPASCTTPVLEGPSSFEAMTEDLDALVRRVDPDRWLSSRFVADEAARADLIVRWKEGVRMDEADRLLQSISADVVGGPGGNGAWRLRVPGPLRVGHDATVALELRNGKAFLPTYGLWFELLARPIDVVVQQRAESTVTGRGIDVRELLAKAEAGLTRGQLGLRERLEPEGEARMEWGCRPEKRGLLRVELVGVGSLFPFGFLKKEI
eukprot:gene5344-7253_t